MGLAFIPVYIKYLGIEAYALIGIFALLQVWLSVLDMGLAPTLSREMARYKGGVHTAQSIRDILRSIEIISLSIGVFIAILVTFSSQKISTSWVQAESLSVATVTQAFVIMGLVASIRFMEGIYRSCIIGLERQILLNVVNSAVATMRSFGAVFVLMFISPSIEAFFIWQGMVSIASLLIFISITYSSLPQVEKAGRFSTASLQSVWRFAGGMLGITVLSIILTQVDKILLSKLLSLSDYGYYILAATVAGALHIFIGPITQAFYPRICELYARRNEKELIETYHQGAQLVSVLAGSAAIVLILFSETILRIWTQDALLAERTALLVSILTIGNLLNGLMWIPYQTQLAHGWTRLTININVVAVALIFPALIWITPIYGAVGAAWLWVALNVGYILIGVQFMYRRILHSEKWKWYIMDVLLPLGAGLIAATLVRSLWTEKSGTISDLLLIIFATCLTLASTILSADRMRPQIKKAIKQLLKTSRHPV